ncbi:MAG: nicotinate (nicotinamide) nucleotide adenylyltransferase [Phycisphaerae bacterium]|nr:nicotinate (nicotinamide) nucleotide adenylyltransferase [Phycisphaerae bacterium]
MPRHILFGGSFDPIHHGHLIVARAAMEKCGAAGVLFMPARVSPHKTHRPITDARHRFNMISLAIKAEPAFAVSKVEINRLGPSYTWDTVGVLEKADPDQKFVLLLGWDQLAGLGTWHRVNDLLARVDVMVLPRGDQARGKISRPAGVSARTWRKVLSGVIAAPRLDISSTAIRDRVRRGLSIEYLVPEPVARYIIRHRLYHQA